MRAVRMVAVGRPLEMHDVPVPVIGDRDVLVRVRAAGICHSDAHYRAGTSRVEPLPLTLGHEVAGVIEGVGKDVRDRRIDDRVCLHYLLSCGDCHPCRGGNEQFCVQGSMIGHFSDGGYAEYLAAPAAWACRRSSSRGRSPRPCARPSSRSVVPRAFNERHRRQRWP